MVEVNYRYNSKNENVRKTICDIFTSKNHGETVLYTDISREIGINIEIEEELKKLKMLVGSVKNILIDKGKVIKSISNLGWYILKPTQVASYTYRTCIIKPMKSYEKAKRILQHTNTINFNDERKKEYSDVKELNEMMSDVSLNIIQESDYFANKEHYDNIKD